MAGIILKSSLLAFLCTAYVSAHQCGTVCHSVDAGCIGEIILTATTSATFGPAARTESPHRLEIKVKGVLHSAAIPCKGNCEVGMSADFRFSPSDFFPVGAAPSCLKAEDIAEVALKAGGNDGWAISSASAIYRTTCSNIVVATTVKKNFVIDGDQTANERRQVLPLA